MENLELFADLPAARQPRAWHAVASGFGRNIAWACPLYPGVKVRHCCHPTAHYPYFVEGLPALHGRTFTRLKEAQAAVARAATITA